MAEDDARVSNPVCFSMASAIDGADAARAAGCRTGRARSSRVSGAPVGELGPFGDDHDAVFLAGGPALRRGRSTRWGRSIGTSGMRM